MVNNSLLVKLLSLHFLFETSLNLIWLKAPIFCFCFFCNLRKKQCIILVRQLKESILFPVLLNKAKNNSWLFSSRKRNYRNLQQQPKLVFFPKMILLSINIYFKLRIQTPINRLTAIFKICSISCSKRFSIPRPACSFLHSYYYYPTTVDNENSRIMYEICSKLAIETLERRQWRDVVLASLLLTFYRFRYFVSTVYFEQVDAGCEGTAHCHNTYHTMLIVTAQFILDQKASGTFEVTANLSGLNLRTL